MMAVGLRFQASPYASDSLGVSLAQHRRTLALPQVLFQGLTITKMTFVIMSMSKVHELGISWSWVRVRITSWESSWLWVWAAHIMNSAHELGCFEENLMEIDSITKSSFIIFSWFFNHGVKFWWLWLWSRNHEGFPGELWDCSWVDFMIVRPWKGVKSSLLVVPLAPY